MLPLAVTAVFLVLSLPDPASAQTEEPAEDLEDPEARREARALFDLAHAHYDAGRYAEAAAEFQRVYELTHRPELLYNLHLAYRDAGDVAGAARALRAYLELETSIEPAQRRTLVRRLAAMEDALATGPSRTDAATTEGAVEPGSSEAATSEAGTAEATEADAEGAQAGDVSSGAATELGTPIQPADGIDATGGAVALGLSGALGIAAGIAGGIAATTAADRDARCSSGPTMDACPAGYDQSTAVATFASARDAAWGLGITAGVAAVTGVVLLIVGATDDAPTVSASAGCGPDGCGALFHGRF